MPDGLKGNKNIMNTGISLTEKMCPNNYVVSVINDRFVTLSESTCEFVGITEIVLKISHFPTKLRFSAKYPFFVKSLNRGHYQPTYQPPDRVTY